MELLDRIEHPVVRLSNQKRFEPATARGLRIGRASTSGELRADTPASITHILERSNGIAKATHGTAKMPITPASGDRNGQFEITDGQTEVTDG